MIEDYLTVKQLREAIKDLPDDMPVYYQRIEDVYFEKHGWEADKLMTSDFTDPDWGINDEYLRAFCAFTHDGDLCITAHY